ncbi:MAG TPA: sulfotransferase family 2 domain-containing protein [Candidatus Sulfotelmatobacter sp.]|nr:sulfotransferase family 2 domain-containing protein [Candidatus Sulfotelmatobacter sp.]
MPISHDDRFIFIHIPKTAGSSIVESLLTVRPNLDFMARNAWPRLFAHPRGAELFRQLRVFYPLNPMALFPEQHYPARVLREMVPAEVWSSYFKFTFVRNPWDFVVSSYFFLKKTFSEDPRVAMEAIDVAYIMASVDFTNFVRARKFMANSIGLLPHVTDQGGNLLVDFVGKVENIEADLAEICRRVGLNIPLEHRNRSEHAQYREYYTDETRAIVAADFAPEIERFGYRF